MTAGFRCTCVTWQRHLAPPMRVFMVMYLRSLRKSPDLGDTCWVEPGDIANTKSDTVPLNPAVITYNSFQNQIG